MCILYVCIYICMHVHVEARSPHCVHTISVHLFYFILFWRGLSVNLELTYYNVRLTGQQASCVLSLLCPFFSHSAGITSAHSHTHLFTWVLGIWTEVTGSILPLSHLPRPSTFLHRRYWLYQLFKLVFNNRARAINPALYVIQVLPYNLRPCH